MGTVIIAKIRIIFVSGLYGFLLLFILSTMTSQVSAANKGRRTTRSDPMATLAFTPPAVNDFDIEPPLRPAYCENVSVTEADLSTFLLKKHDPIARPIKDPSKPMIVWVGFALERVDDIIEKDQTITLSAYLILKWVNEFIVWKNISGYNCVNQLIVPSKKVWLPEISFQNSQDKFQLMLMHGNKVIIEKNGTCHYYPSSTFPVSCILDLTNFPFDRQVCTIELQTWAYWNTLQALRLDNPPFLLITTAEHEQWKLEYVTSSIDTLIYQVSWKQYDIIRFSLHLTRKSAFYVISVIIPNLILAAIEVVVFTVPVDEPLKVDISLTCLLAVSLFQAMIVGDIPKSSERPPRFCVFLDLQMMYISVVLLGQGVIFLLLKKGAPGKPPPPTWLWRIFSAAAYLSRHRAQEGQQEAINKCDDGENVASHIAEKRTPPKHSPDSNHRSNDSKLPNDRLSSPTREAFVSLQASIGITNSLLRSAIVRLELLQQQEKRYEPTWYHMATTVERCLMLFYVTAILVTPTVFFFVFPNI